MATNHCNLFFRDKSQIGYKITVLGFKGAIYLSGFSNWIVRLSGLGLKARLEIRRSL